LLETPSAEIEVGGEQLRVRAELLDETAFKALWPAFVAIYPGYEAYLTRLTHRHPRMFRLHPGMPVR
jgi:hypothetical protein